jgi:hypothetical protein
MRRFDSDQESAAGGYEGACVKEYRLEEDGAVKQLLYEGAHRKPSVSEPGGNGATSTYRPLRGELASAGWRGPPH